MAERSPVLLVATRRRQTSTHAPIETDPADARAGIRSATVRMPDEVAANAESRPAA